jgi:hypothetical protein
VSTVLLGVVCWMNLGLGCRPRTTTMKNCPLVVGSSYVTCKRALHPGSLIQTSTDEIAGCSMRDISSNCPNKAIQSQIWQVK